MVTCLSRIKIDHSSVGGVKDMYIKQERLLFYDFQQYGEKWK